MKCLQRTFCSFRTPLFPLLACVAVLSLYTFVSRLLLKCEWNVGWTETASMVQFLLAATFAYGILRERGWLCSGWFAGCVFCVYSAVVAICEGVVDDCKGEDKPDGDDDGDFSIPGWTIPVASAALCVFWAACAYLFNLGYKEHNEELAEAKARARERRQPLLR